MSLCLSVVPGCEAAQLLAEEAPRAALYADSTGQGDLGELTERSHSEGYYLGGAGKTCLAVYRLC